MDIYPGGIIMRRWSAKDNNGPLFQFVELPKCRSDLSFSFLPSHMHQGLVLFIDGWVIVLLAYGKVAWNKLSI